MSEKTLWSIPEFCDAVGIGVNSAYKFAHESGCGLRIGRKVYIHIPSFNEWCVTHTMEG